MICLGLAALAGWWLGEGGVPLGSLSGAALLLLFVFGAAGLAPSPRRQEKYYVMAAALILILGSWSAGQATNRRAFHECLERGNVIRASLESFHQKQGHYPESLDELTVDLPGRRRLHPDLLDYRRLDDNYELTFFRDNLRFAAGRHVPFSAQRQEP
ncbi:hypothetical protein [Trichloromonas sp.]|uniref:hypothetical protein n=1 Tax=Trichloromonas sp. TaxID=3069249 RepID=UPI002A3D368E|nr:hypothetical protein [Trichloromonas sp.]